MLESILLRTQMIERMENNEILARAEVSDLVNATLDFTDARMALR